MVTNEIDTRFNNIVEHYQGSCQSLKPEDEEFIEEHDLYDRLDDEIFECATCGWWCETSEKSEDESDETCQECYEDAQLE